MTSKARICVFCGSRTGRDPRCAEAARALGAAIARFDCDLVFGGGNGGLMGIVSQTALSGGARVTGIIPNFLFEREPPADNLTELITVEDFSSRKRLMMERADAFVVLPGGIGTLEEAFEVLTNLSIGRLQKPIGFLDLDGYYQPLLAFLKKSAEAGFVDPSLFFRAVLAPRPEELLSGLLARLSHEAPAKTRS